MKKAKTTRKAQEGRLLEKFSSADESAGNTLVSSMRNSMKNFVVSNPQPAKVLRRPASSSKMLKVFG